MKKCACLTLLTTLLVTLGACTTKDDTTTDESISESTLEEDTTQTWDDQTIIHPETSYDPEVILSYIESAGCNLDSWSGLTLTLEYDSEYFGAVEKMSETIVVTTRKGNLVVLDTYEETLSSLFGDYYTESKIDYYEGGVIYTNYNGKVTHKSDNSTTLDYFKEVVYSNYDYILYLFDSYVTYQEDYFLDFTGSCLKEEDDLIKASIDGTQDYEYDGMNQGGYVKLDVVYRNDLTVDSIFYDDYSAIDYGSGLTYINAQSFQVEEYTGVIEIPDWLQ